MVRQREVALPILYKYGRFQELEKHLAKIKAPWVTLQHTDNDLFFGLVNEIGDVVTKVVVDESLGFLVESSCKEIPDNHEIFKEHRRTVSTKHINFLLKGSAGWTQCMGIVDSSLKGFGMHLVSSGRTTNLIIGYSKIRVEMVQSLHSRNCCMLVSDPGTCSECKLFIPWLKLQNYV